MCGCSRGQAGVFGEAAMHKLINYMVEITATKWRLSSNNIRKLIKGNFIGEKVFEVGGMTTDLGLLNEEATKMHLLKISVKIRFKIFGNFYQKHI